MKRFLTAAALAITTATATVSSAQAAQLPPSSFADIVEKLSPAVVNISTTQVVKGFQQQQPQGAMPSFPPGSPFQGFEEFFRQQQQPTQRKATSLGSGFIIDSSGIIVTNNHVVRGGTDISVTLQDNTELKAKVIGADSKIDIVVLKVDSPKPLPFVTFGDSDLARVGDWVLAIGNPYGLGGSVSSGIISARGRDINVGAFDDFLQTDAAINRGNSGGPMFNMNGEVIGVNTAIFSPSGGNVGIGFAMPASLVKPSVDQIIKYGHVKRAWMGIKIQAVTEEIAKSLGLKQEAGALVLGVVPKGPAALAGIKEGDVIISFDGKKIEAMRKFPRIVAETDIGTKVKVQIFRNGKYLDTTATLTEMTEEQEKAEAAALQGKEQWPSEVYVEKSRILLGMKLIEINPSIQKAFKLTADKGILVADVKGGKVSEFGIAEGDIITKANQIDVTNFAQLELAIKEAKEAGKTSILLMVLHGTSSRFVGVPIE